MRLKLNTTSSFILPFHIHFKLIVYKKTGEWYIEWQRVVQRVTASDNEWQRMTTSCTTSDNEWQRVTKSENEGQWVTASESSGTVNENGTMHFKEWMIAIISLTKRDTLLLQEMDGCN